jgi:hypothetical protein
MRLCLGAAQSLDQHREQDLHPAEGVEAHGKGASSVQHPKVVRNFIRGKKVNLTGKNM